MFIEGQSSHACEHGRLILNAMLANKHLSEAKKAIGGEREPVSTEGLFLLKNFEMAPRSDNDVLLIREVPPTTESASANLGDPYMLYLFFLLLRQRKQTIIVTLIQHVGLEDNGGLLEAKVCFATK